MKIMINFDLINAVLDVNQGFSVKKIVRNKKRQWAIINYPIYIVLDVACSKGNIGYALGLLAFQTGITIIPEYLSGLIINHDIYKLRSEERLKKLIPKLQDNHLSISYQQLLKSELYERRYHFEFNKGKLPELMEEKYILVPCHNPYSCDHREREVSILQEHVIGSKEYILSIGTPSKQYKLSPVMGRV